MEGRLLLQAALPSQGAQSLAEWLRSPRACEDPAALVCALTAQTLDLPLPGCLHGSASSVRALEGRVGCVTPELGGATHPRLHIPSTVPHVYLQVLPDSGAATCSLHLIPSRGLWATGYRFICEICTNSVRWRLSFCNFLFESRLCFQASSMPGRSTGEQ